MRAPMVQYEDNMKPLSENDKKVVEMVSGREYDDFVTELPDGREPRIIWGDGNESFIFVSGDPKIADRVVVEVVDISEFGPEVYITAHCSQRDLNHFLSFLTV